MPTPSYPNFAGKHAEQALFSAADFVAYQRQVGALDDREVPGGAVLCYQPSLSTTFSGPKRLIPAGRPHLPLPLPSTGGRWPAVGIARPGARWSWTEGFALG